MYNPQLALKKENDLKINMGGMVFWPLAGIFGVFLWFIQVYRTNHHYDILFF